MSETAEEEIEAEIEAETGTDEDQLGSEKIGKLVTRFSIPAIISMVVGSLYNIVDQIFIGQGVGMLGNAATNVAFPIVTISTATALFLGIGSSANYNLEMGRGHKDHACRIIGTGLFMLGTCGIAIAVIVLVFLTPLLNLFGATEDVLPYAQDYAGITALGIPFFILTTGGNHMIRADQSPSYSMACMLTGSILNMILDPIFIFVFHWGIRGAAAATVTGQVISGLMVILYFTRFKHLKLKFSMLRPVAENIKAIASLGMASCVNQLALTLMQVVMNNVLRRYGADSIYGADIPLACVGIVTKINQVFLSVCIGISQGCQPIWGYNYGAEKYKRVRETYRDALLLVLGVGVLFFLAFQIFPDQIIRLFGTGSGLYFEFGRRYLKIFMFMTFINGVQPMSPGFFTSIGKAVLGVILSLTRQVFLLIPLLLILPTFWGIDGVMYAGPAADTVAAAVAIGLAVREWRSMKKMEGV